MNCSPAFILNALIIVYASGRGRRGHTRPCAWGPAVSSPGGWAAFDHHRVRAWVHPVGKPGAVAAADQSCPIWHLVIPGSPAIWDLVLMGTLLILAQLQGRPESEIWSHGSRLSDYRPWCGLRVFGLGISGSAEAAGTRGVGH